MSWAALVLGWLSLDGVLDSIDGRNFYLQVLYVWWQNRFFLLMGLNLHAAKALIIQLECLLALPAFQSHIILSPFVFLLNRNRQLYLD
jgi:hypothetical protein